MVDVELDSEHYELATDKALANNFKQKMQLKKVLLFEMQKEQSEYTLTRNN